MANQSTRGGDARIKTSSGSESASRKFTLSCSRCRASKLKCDKQEPCIECVRRNLGHLCTKDERQPRAKRAKTEHNSKNDNKTSALQDYESQAEEATQAIERFVNGTSRTSAPPSAVLPVPDYPNMFWSSINGQQRQDEKLALIREIVNALPELDMIRHLHQVFVSRCQGPLGNVVHTPTFLKQAEKFNECFNFHSLNAQVTALSSRFSMDMLACHLLALTLALAFHPTSSLLCWSPTPLALRVQELRASYTHCMTWRLLASRCLQGGVSFFCGSIASLQAAIMLLLDGHEGSLALDAILVTAISGARKLGLHRQGDSMLEASESPASPSEDGSSVSTEALHIRTEIGIRIWWALVMRDWSRGQALGYYSIRPSQFNTRMPLHINDDDLCPQISKVNVPCRIVERPRSEFTMLSYTVHALEVAVFARESIDLGGPLHQARIHNIDEDGKARNHLNKRYEHFVAGLPSYFRLGSAVGLTSTGPMAAIPVQRWMLHQQLWSLFLRLPRARLSSHDGQAFCQLLAQNIISNQAQIQARCTVCGSLSTSETQLFHAAVLLLVDLLCSFKHDDADRSTAQLSRLMTRDKIREAIELLQTQSDITDSPYPNVPHPEGVKICARRRIAILDALMQLEEDEYTGKDEGDAANSTGNRLGRPGVKSSNIARKPLKSKIMDILEALEDNDQNAFETMKKASLESIPLLDMSRPSLSTPSPATTNGFQNIDLLPILSNDSGSDFWQYLDFAQSPTEKGFFSAAADLQIFDSSMHSLPPSGMTCSLNSYETSNFIDVYSSTDGNCVTHMPTSSIENGSNKSGSEWGY